MADNSMPPVVPQLTTPVPQRTDPENFSVRMDLTLFEMVGVINGINATASYIQQAGVTTESVAAIRDEAANSAATAVAAAAMAGAAAEFPEQLTGTEGKPLTRVRNGNGVHYSEEFTPFINVSEATQFVVGERYRVDTSEGGFDLTLPENPFTGATLWLFDAMGTWRRQMPVLLRNGETIMGVEEDMELDVGDASIMLMFDGSTWRVL